MSKETTKDRGLDIITYGQAEVNFLKRLNTIVNTKDAKIEIKKNDLGLKQAIIKLKEEIIYSTSNQEEVKNFEEFLENPQKFLETLSLRKMEAKFNQDVTEEFQTQLRDRSELPDEDTPDYKD